MHFRSILYCVAACATACHVAAGETGQKPQDQPRLILAIVVDQFRYDYTTRFRDRYTGGICTLLSEGAVFMDAHQDHFPTVTATGHATLLTGSVPATSGIIANEWFDRKLGKSITSVEDADTKLLGVEGDKPGSSPHNLIVTTLGDEIKSADQGSTKVIGISMKDRAAILPAGRMADAAYWVDANTGNVVSSTWYQAQLPSWVEAFNAQKPALKALGAAWRPVGQPNANPYMELPATPGKPYFSQWEQTPYANEMLEDLAEQAIKHEALGQHHGTDVLTVSFSANDHLGHALGPDSLEVRDMSVRTDLVLGKLLAAAEKQVGGKSNLLVVFTADHGVSPVPELNLARKLPGGRFDKHEYLDAIQTALVKKFGEGQWLLGGQESGFYFDYDLLEQKKLKRSEVEDTVAEAAMQLPYVARVYTRTQLLRHEAAQSQIDDYVARGFFPQRGPDVMVIMKPYYLADKAGTSHGSPYDYDSHVPLIFFGGKIKPGKYAGGVGISDVAPTLAAILQIQAPSGNMGTCSNRSSRPTWQLTRCRADGSEQNREYRGFTLG